MSPSERAALAVVDRAEVDGLLSARESRHWRAAVATPCGCAEGLAGAVLAGVAAAVAGPHDLTPAGLVIGSALLAGALVGKVVGVVRGLPLARHQRAALDRRVLELEDRRAAPASCGRYAETA